MDSVINLFSSDKVPVVKYPLPLVDGIELFIKREDLLHREISGNKFRKLKYNISKAKELGYNKILTFGGAYSNHIAATAAACRIFGFDCIGVIRGEELINKIEDNPTLSKAIEDGMTLEFVTRTQYRNKNDEAFFAMLEEKFGKFYLVPEGGTNDEAIKGTEEILKSEDSVYQYICTAVGTGGTIAGIINSSFDGQRVIGFPALRGDFLYDEIKKYTLKDNWDLSLEYHFGGYGKYNNELLEFIFSFKENTGVLLDPIYTGKMMYGVMDMINSKKFSAGTKILAIHTGGLQGWNDNIKIVK
ncbi:pyridoxal-phosphate dependent enzyme [Myroides injenensis]|uniref:1-aminocyclopropane-1-carboxylate deaminase/D-cysteine desulfhydrase n=1 Tax=Myroides injenensis TaxID=1183151 RepID=UPI0002894D97